MCNNKSERAGEREREIGVVIISFASFDDCTKLI